MKVNAEDLAKALQALDWFAKQDHKVDGLGFLDVLDARIHLRMALRSLGCEVSPMTELTNDQN